MTNLLKNRRKRKQNSWKYLEKKKKEKDKQNLEKRQIIDRFGVSRKGKCAIVGDPMLNGIDERRILKTNPIEVRFFPGAHIKTCIII